MILTVRDTQSERAESITTQHENDAGAHESHYPLSESSTGGILPTVDSSSSLSSGYADFFTNSAGLYTKSVGLWPAREMWHTSKLASAIVFHPSPH